nr:unnamed protein product [Spirometra erinaceieuropaei]
MARRLQYLRLKPTKGKQQSLSLSPLPPLGSIQQAAGVSPLTPAAWNVCPLLDNLRSNRPKRRTALTAREPAVGIVALSETRFSEQGQLEEVNTDGTFFWSGRSKAEAGVTFPIRSGILGRLFCLTQGINDCAMSGWFDDNDVVISTLLGEKNRLHKTNAIYDNKAEFYRSRRLLQQRLQEIQDAWTACKAEKIQGHADRNEWKNYSAIKTVYDPAAKDVAPLLSADETALLIEKARILERWVGHFSGISIFTLPSGI